MLILMDRRVRIQMFLVQHDFIAIGIAIHRTLALRKLVMVNNLHILRLEDNIVGIAFLCTTKVSTSLILDASVAKRSEKFACSLIIIEACIIRNTSH